MWNNALSFNATNIDRTAGGSAGHKTLVVQAVNLGWQTFAEFAINVIRAQQGADENEKVEGYQGERYDVAVGQTLTTECLIFELATWQEGSREAFVGALVEIGEWFVSTTMKLKRKSEDQLD